MIMITVAVLTGALSALAEGVDDEAKAQFQQGVELYKAGEHEQAAIAFERAYELKPNYKILYNIGQARNELRRYAQALGAYEQYLSDGGGEIDQKRKDEVLGEIKRLKTLVGFVRVEADRDGLTVFVDGHKQGPTPLAAPVPLDLGEHEVIIKDGTDEVHSEVIKVAGGKTGVVTVGEPAGTHEATPLPAGTTDSQPDDGPKRAWTWVALGVGVAAGIGAGVTGGITLSRADDLKSDCPDNTCPSDKKSDLDSAKTLGNVSTALTVVAAVGIAAGVALFFIEPGLGKEETPVAIIPTATPDGAALTVTGRF